MSVKCPECGTVLRDGALFCTGCGARIAVKKVSGLKCPACHTVNKIGTHFCVECGYSFEEPVLTDTMTTVLTQESKAAIDDFEKTIVMDQTSIRPAMPDEYQSRCPECGAFISLKDDICPRCHHVLKENTSKESFSPEKIEPVKAYASPEVVETHFENTQSVIQPSNSMQSNPVVKEKKDDKLSAFLLIIVFILSVILGVLIYLTLFK